MGKKSISVLEKLLPLLGLESRPLEKWLTNRQSQATKHLPDIAGFIAQVFRNCADKLQQIQTTPESTSCIPAYQRGNKWTIFLDKLSTSNDLNTMATLLFKTLVQELISNEKDYKPFWNTAYKELSEKLSSPTGTGLADLGMSSSKALSVKQVEKLPCLTLQKTSLQSKNSPTTYSPSSISSAVDRWEKENTKKPIKFKTLAVRVFPTNKQKQMYREAAGCFRYVHNKALERVKRHGDDPNFFNLRNMLVTGDTKLNSQEAQDHAARIQQQVSILGDIRASINAEKVAMGDKVDADLTLQQSEKDTLRQFMINNEPCELDGRSETFLKYMAELTAWDSKILAQQELIATYKSLKTRELKSVASSKNPNVLDWELKFHKELRANAVNKVCLSYKTAKANFKAGNIKFFSINYMKLRDERQCVELSSCQLSIKNGRFHIPLFKGHSGLRVSVRMVKKLKNLQISNNCDFVRQKNSYWIHIPVPVVEPAMDRPKVIRYCGVDPGIVKIATTFGNSGTTEYTHNRELLKRLNEKIKLLKSRRYRGGRGVRKKQISKVEKRKIDYTNQLHWELVKSLLDDNEVVFFGDIKSHDIVKNSSASSLNQEFNDLKFYTLKQRLIYKARLRGKKVVLVNEYLTSKTCSSCGGTQEPNDRRVYDCKKCLSVFDRDTNAAKNILMKGIIQL